MKKDAYIVLSQSYTFLARVIKFITKDRYSHVSITFDDSCEKMYSIGRKYTYCPFIGEYRIESIYEGVYARNKKSEIMLYKISLTNKQYKNIIYLLDKYGNSCKGYNLIGLILAIFNKKVNRDKYYCSEFLYKILSNDLVNIYPITNDIVKPMDFINIKGSKKLYEGKVINYRKNYLVENININKNLAIR